MSDAAEKVSLPGDADEPFAKNGARVRDARKRPESKPEEHKPAGEKKDDEPAGEIPGRPQEFPAQWDGGDELPAQYTSDTGEGDKK